MPACHLDTNKLCLIVAIAAVVFVASLPRSAEAQAPLNAELATNPNDSEIEPQKTIWVANVLRRKSAELLIKQLELTDVRFPILLVAKENELRPTVSIRGRFDRPGWKLFVQEDKPVQFETATNRFTVHAYLKGRISSLHLLAVGPNGEKENEDFYIYAPDAMQFTVVSAWDQVLLTLGASYLSYSQVGFGEYQAITGMLSARYSTPENNNEKIGTDDGWRARLGAIANADITVLTVVSSPVDRGPQIFEGKLDATYQFKPDPTKRWRTQGLGGLSFITMLNYGSPFGFSNLVATEVGLRTRYIRTPLDAIIGEVRFIPLSSSLSFDQYAINALLAWSKLISDSHRLELGLSYSGYYYRPDPEIPIRLHLLSFRASLSI